MTSSHQQRANGTQGVWTHTSPTRRKEVALSTKAVIDRLAKVQRDYLRRLLGLNPRSQTIPLYTETGQHPVMHRRAEAALNYLSYLVSERLHYHGRLC